MKKKFCYGWVLAGILLAGQVTAGNNILLIIADDVGIDSYGLYNDDPSASLPPTPNLDRLATQGILFEQAYAYPTCSPTRAATLTGRYGYRTGIMSPGASIALEETTLADLLTDHATLGYHAASIGKWHLGGNERGPKRRGGWDHFSGTADNIMDYENWTKLENAVSTSNHTVYATTDNVNEAVEWIEQQGGNDWLLWVGFNAAHSPFHLPPLDLHSYDSLENNESVINANPRPYFEATLEAMDTELGRLLDAVGTNLSDTTVIFIGDNGTSSRVIQPPYDINQRAKGSLYEGGTHVPLIIAGADVVNPGRTSSDLVHCADLFATMLELTGADLDLILTGEVGIDSRSLLPIVQDQAFSPAESKIRIDSDNLTGGIAGRAVLDGTYKLIRVDGLADEFYNLTLDPLESDNLLSGNLSFDEQAAFNALSEMAGASQSGVAASVDYVIVDSGQTACYDANGGYTISAPEPGAAFAGQDAQYAGILPEYLDNGDGTVTDIKTGLMWQQTPNLTDKMTFAEMETAADALILGGHDDWRFPTLKELYSLMNFNGETAELEEDAVPYLNTNYFDFVYGDTNVERLIDAQYWSSTEYAGTTMNGDATVFGVNFADGRIKGYPKFNPVSGEGMTAFVRFVRGNTSYGVNSFSDNDDGTVTDRATGLMWQQDDSGTGLNWEEGLAYAEGLELAGYKDWRMPNAKELQSLVDYTRAPAVTGTAAIDTGYFNVTTNESFYWTSTSHLDGLPDSLGNYAVYVCFGRALGWMEQPKGSGNYTLLDVHGAGAQRSDPKTGDPDAYPYGHGPQGDVIRIYNYVRCVRGSAQEPIADTDADGLSDWVEFSETGSTTSLDKDGDLDGDSMNNSDEYGAGTSLSDKDSVLAITGMSTETNGVLLHWMSQPGKTYRIMASTNLVEDAFSREVNSGISATAPINMALDAENTGADNLFYRIEVE